MVKKINKFKKKLITIIGSVVVGLVIDVAKDKVKDAYTKVKESFHTSDDPKDRDTK